MNPAALDGLRVLDLSHALAGPYCTLLLADYGARVYKLESPEGGDMGRGWGPPFVGDHAAFFLGLNRGKLGVSIDLKRAEGVELCLRLMEQVDVVVENFRPGTVDRIGLGYETARARNPRLIYCAVSGYGQTGPAREGAAMDLIMQAASGLMSITGTEDGEQVRCGYSVCDVTAGLLAVIGILMALHSRERSGVGQYVDISMFDAMISTMSSNYMQYLGSGVEPRPLGASFATLAPYTVFQGSDGRRFALAVGSEKLWSAFCREVIDRPDLEADPDFASNARRVEHRPRLEEMLAAIFAGEVSGHWVEKLNAAGVPCSLVRTFSEVVEHPQAAFRGMFPMLGDVRVTGAPVKFSDSPAKTGLRAPGLGEHSVRVVRELLGLDDDALDELVASRVLVQR